MNEINEQEDTQLEERLLDHRPHPSAGFRSRLRTTLLATLNRRGVAPKRLRLLVAAYAGSGFALLVAAILGVTGAGPLAP